MRKPVDKQRLKAAIEYFEENDVLISVAARKFDIPYGSLYNRIIGFEQISQRFTEDEERAILSWAQKEFSGRKSLYSDSLTEVANRILRKKGQRPVCDNWSFGFINRYPEIRACFAWRRKRERKRARDVEMARELRDSFVKQASRAKTASDVLAAVSGALCLESHLAALAAAKLKARESRTVSVVVGATRRSALGWRYDGPRVAPPPRDKATGKLIRRCKTCCGLSHNSRSCHIAKILAEEDREAQKYREVKDEVKEEVEDEVQNEVEDEVKDEVKEEVKEEV